MTTPLPLPDGLSERPLVPTDAAAVTAVMAAQELHDVGEVVIEEADIVAEWQSPGYDVPGSTVGVFDGETLVAYAEVSHGERGDAAVHPEHRGRGLGTALARWMQERAREKGSSRIGMPVPVDSPGDRLLESLGYFVRWNSWVLRLPAGTAVPQRDLPEGFAVGVASPEQYPQCWTVQEDAFLEWSDRDRQSFEQWRAWTDLRPGFEPWHLRVVTDPAGDVVAVAVLQIHPPCAYIARLATRRDQRGRGLAQALLVDAFAAGAAHGTTVCELSTDSRTGALGLYEKVGMVVTSNWVNRAIDV
ncbi:GNAT family N-acetyltransferase [Nocardioides ungokensis]